MTESSKLQSSLPMGYLSVVGEKLSIVLMCVVPLLLPVLTSIEHI